MFDLKAFVFLPSSIIKLECCQSVTLFNLDVLISIFHRIQHHHHHHQLRQRITSTTTPQPEFSLKNLPFLFFRPIIQLIIVPQKKRMIISILNPIINMRMSHYMSNEHQVSLLLHRLVHVLQRQHIIIIIEPIQSFLQCILINQINQENVPILHVQTTTNPVNVTVRVCQILVQR